MNNRRSLFAFLFVAAVLALAAIAPLWPRADAQSVAPSGSAGSSGRTSDPKIVYPVSKKVDVVDDYFGTKVADPYRSLEDETLTSTQAFIEANNARTRSFLDGAERELVEGPDKVYRMLSWVPSAAHRQRYIPLYSADGLRWTTLPCLGPGGWLRMAAELPQKSAPLTSP